MHLLSFAVFLSATWIMNIIGHLTTIPKNVVAKLEARVELECDTDAKIPVRWNFSPAGSQNSTFIYHSGVITYSLKDKYVIDNSRTGRYNLIMNSVDLSFGGTYICYDTPTSHGGQQSTRLSGSAELTVLVADPVCRTNASAVVMEGDYIQIVCTFNYTGNWLPIMKCNKSSGRNIDANTTYTTSMSSLLTQLTSADNGVTITCNTTFKPMSTDSTRNRTRTEVGKESSVPDYHYSWNFTSNVTDMTTVIDREKATTNTTALTDNGAKTTVKLAVIIGTNAGAVILCLSIGLVVYKICKKGNAKPDIVPVAKQNSNDTSDRPQVDLVPPLYAEVQRHSNGFQFVEAHPSPVYTTVKKQTMVDDTNKPTVTNNYKQNQNFPVYAEVKKIEKEKKIPGPSGQTPLLNETKPKQNYAGADGTQYMELDSLTELKSNGVTTKRPPMFNLVETYATIDHTLVVPPPPPPSLPRRHQH